MTQKEYNESILFQSHPFKSFKSKNNLRKPGNFTNSIGYRNREISMEKPESLTRIICIGGSTTFSSGAKNIETTWTSYMEEYLKKKVAGKNIEVINAGVPAYTSLQNMIDLETNLLYYKPDIITIMAGLNDASVIINSGGFKPDYTHICIPFHVPEPSFWEYSPFLSLIFPNSISPYNNWNKNASFPLTRYIYKIPETKCETDEFLYEPFRNNMSMMVEICQTRNIKPVIINQVFKNDESLWAKINLKLNKISAETALKYKIPFVDLYSFFPYKKYREYFYDAVHLNHKKGGYKIWGQEIGSVIFYSYFKENK